MRLFLIRHGETWWNEIHKFQGSSDVELSPQGWRQAQKLAISLKDEPVAKIYTSPLKRAQQTAAEVAKCHHCPITILDGLRELHQGHLEGLTGEELKQKYPDFLREWLKNPADVKLPGGESLRELQQRAWEAIEKIRKENATATVVAVAHNFVNITILCKILEISLNNFRYLKQDPTAKNLIVFSSKGTFVHLLNDTCHLKH